MNEFPGAACEAARAMCSRLNGTCHCRENAHWGTCSEKFDAFNFALATFLGHPQLRTKSILSHVIKLWMAVFPKNYQLPRKSE